MSLRPQLQKKQIHCLFSFLDRVLDAFRFPLCSASREAQSYIFYVPLGAACLCDCINLISGSSTDFPALALPRSLHLFTSSFCFMGILLRRGQESNAPALKVAAGRGAHPPGKLPGAGGRHGASACADPAGGKPWQWVLGASDWCLSELEYLAVFNGLLYVQR